MASITDNIAEYESLRSGLEVDHMGKWVLIHDRKVIDLYESFEAAAKEAVRLFGPGPYLIRQVGAPPVTLPASVVHRLNYA